MGIDRSTYAYYELGRTEPSLDKLMLFATFYQVSADFLLDLPPVKNKKNQKVEALLAYPPDANHITQSSYNSYLRRLKNQHHNQHIQKNQLKRQRRHGILKNPNHNK